MTLAAAARVTGSTAVGSIESARAFKFVSLAARPCQSLGSPKSARALSGRRRPVITC